MQTQVNNLQHNGILLAKYEHTERKQRLRRRLHARSLFLFEVIFRHTRVLQVTGSRELPYVTTVFGWQRFGPSLENRDEGPQKR